MNKENSTFEYENPEGQIKTGDVLPPVKDLDRIRNNLILEDEKIETEKHVNLLHLNKNGESETYLILTDVKNDAIQRYQKMFGAAPDPVPIGIFLDRVFENNAVSKLPESFNDSRSQIFKIVT